MFVWCNDYGNLQCKSKLPISHSFHISISKLETGHWSGPGHTTWTGELRFNSSKVIIEKFQCSGNISANILLTKESPGTWFKHKDATKEKAEH